MSSQSLLQSSFDYQFFSCDFQHPPIIEDSFFQRIFNGFPKPRFQTIDRGVVYLFINFLRVGNPQLESESINHFSIISKKRNRRQIKLTADESNIRGSEVRFDHPIIFPVSFETDNGNCLRKFATIRLEVRRSEASRIIESKTFRLDIGSLINNYRTHRDDKFSQSVDVPTQWIHQKVPLVDIGILDFAFAFRSANDESRGRSLAESHLRYMNEIVTNALSTPRPALVTIRDPPIAVDVSQHDQSIAASSLILPSASGKNASAHHQDTTTDQHIQSVSVSSIIPPSVSGKDASAHHQEEAVGDAMTDQHNKSVNGLSVEGVPVSKKETVGDAMTSQNDKNLAKSDELDARVSTKQIQFSILKNPSARNVPVESGLQRQLSSAPPTRTRTFILKPQRMWEFSRSCFECKYCFHCFLWRHHCGHCGLSYCYQCSDHFIDLRSPDAVTHVNNDANHPNPTRLCDRCNEEWCQLIQRPRPVAGVMMSTPTVNVTTSQTVVNVTTLQNQDTDIGQTPFRSVHANNRQRRQSLTSLNASTDVFFSMRFTNSDLMAQAQSLRKELLAKKRINAIIVNTENSESIFKVVVDNISQATIVVIFGTEDYGEDTGTGYSSYDELTYIRESRKPFFLIKMCENFKYASTQFRLPNSLMAARWDIGQPVSEEMLEQISRRFQCARFQ